MNSPLEVHQEEARRLSSKQRVLARLQAGPATNDELNDICLRFGARILELRKEGQRIETESLTKGKFVYRLTA